MRLKHIADEMGQSVPFVLGLQKRFALPPCREYSPGYAVLMRKLAFLTVASVPHKDMEALLIREKNLLELLKVDSLDPVSEWFANLCTMKSGPTRLLLSGYDLERETGVQPGLDFATREKELFSHQEMGADALRALKGYREAATQVISRLRQERPLLAAALKWSGRITTGG
jgi:hypothetical protein